jgi:hypothetical protein
MDGLGVEQNKEEGLNLLLKSAHSGFEDAREYVIDCIEHLI